MARILVIDDELEIRVMLERLLKLHGHEVHVASDGAEGFINFAKSNFDLIITDIFMPARDGIETINQFRRQFPDVRIIAISGHDPDGASLSVAKHLGVRSILKKPFSAETLINAIAEAL